MNSRDWTYERIGPEYFSVLLGSEHRGAEILSCERGVVHDEHLSNPEISRWRVTCRVNGVRTVRSFVCKKYSPGHEREIAVYRWLQANTDINMPALVDYRHTPGAGDSWMLTENLVNFKDLEYYYLCRYFFSPPDTWPPATEPTEPPEAFTAPLADLHGKTLGRDWLRAGAGPIPIVPPPRELNISLAGVEQSFSRESVAFSPGMRNKVERIVETVHDLPAPDLFERISSRIGLCHGSMNYQEIGFRMDANFQPIWCLFDWETARIAPIYYDLAQVHYMMGLFIDDPRLSWYLGEVKRLSGIELSREEVREGIDIAYVLLGLERLGWATKVTDGKILDDLLDRLKLL
jgi:hypothetical protein